MLSFQAPAHSWQLAVQLSTVITAVGLIQEFPNGLSNQCLDVGFVKADLTVPLASVWMALLQVLAVDLEYRLSL